MITLFLLIIINNQIPISPRTITKGVYLPNMQQNVRAPHTGTDEYGYHWIDSYEPSGPVYSWIETDSNATTGDDVNVGPIPLPFSFWFYGNVYDSMRICTNGWLSFTSSSNAYDITIPYVYEPNNTIAPFACDLFPGYFGYGSIYYGAYENRYVIMWDSVFGYDGDGPYKFEIILDPLDSSIIYQYHSSPDWQARSSTIGIEDAQGDVGLCGFQGSVINQYAIKFFWIEPPDSNVGVVELLSPTGGDLLIPGSIDLRVKNRGQTTVSFPVTCYIDSSGIVIYSYTQNINNLSAGEKADVTFPLSLWSPSEFFDYDAILYTNLAGDSFHSDDTIYKQLKEPGACSDSGCWDDSLPVNGYYFYSADDVIASEFNPPFYPCLIKYVAVYCLSEGDPYWPWPDSTHDPIEISIWMDRTHDGIPDEPPIWYDTIYGDSVPPSWIYGVPPDSLVINNGKLWVGLRNPRGKGTEAIAVDGATDYPIRKWSREAGLWKNQDYFTGDHMIRAYFSMANLLAHDVRPVKIIEPDSITYTDTMIIPRVLVMNTGYNTETFPVRFIMTKELSTVYDETVQVTNLGSRDTITVSFPSWMPYHLPGEYIARAITNLTGDLDPNNDTLSQNTQIRVYEWRRIASMPDRRMAHATVYSPFNDRIYVIGGSRYYNPYSGNPYNATEDNCWEYNPYSNTWTIKNPMPANLNFIYGAYCNKRIYIIGGYDSTWSGVTTNLIYDIENDSWLQGTPYPDPFTVSAARITWNDSLIYCLGGVVNKGEEPRGVGDVYLYNPGSDTFYKCTSLLTGYISGSVSIFNNDIYITSGKYGPLFCVYDSIIRGKIQVSEPDSIVWQYFDSLPYPLCLSSSGLLNDQIYMVGGVGLIPFMEKLNKVWEYNPNTKQYIALQEHPLPRISGSQFMTIKPDSGWFYTMGGDTDIVYGQGLAHIGTGTASCFKLIKHQVGIEDGNIARRSKCEKPGLEVWPNPFQTTITIRLVIQDIEHSHEQTLKNKSQGISLKIYDVSGRMVKDFRLLQSNVTRSSSISWHGVDERGRRLPAGIYFVRLEVGNYSQTEKIIMVK